MRPYAFRDREPYVRATLCERVAAGAHLKTVCAEPWAPSYRTVGLWRRRDAAFDAALAAALRAGAGARYFPYDEAKAAEIVRRLEAGVSLRAIEADPAMPTVRCIRHWRRTQGAFAEAVWRALRRRRAFIQQAVHPPKRTWDPAVAERVLLAVAKGCPVKRLTSKGLPGKRVIARWRREQPGFDAELAALARMGPRIRSALRCSAMRETVGGRIVDGASLRQVGAEPGMPCRRTLYRWAKHDAGFAAELAQARAMRADWLADEALEVAEGPGEARAKARKVKQLMRQAERLDRR